MKVKKLKKFIIDNSPTNKEIIEFINTPTVISSKNSTVYKLDGKLHRIDGPAIEWSNGDRFWFIKGRRHRTDGPAVEYANGTKEWYKRGKLHRTNGPAKECADGTKMWYINGKLHREDDPAIEWSNGQKEYWINGARIYKNTHGPSPLKNYFYNYYNGITICDSLSVTSSTSGFNYIVSDYCPSNTMIMLGAKYNPTIIKVC